MSEYWVSKKKYWCQYCEIYIADDAPSRSQHENGLRHKGNKDRFIRGLYKTSIKKKQEGEEEKREMKRVEEAAQAAYARDVGAGLVTPGASSSKPPTAAAAPKPKPPPPKPSDPYANYTSAASLGIVDPDLERLIAEAEARKGEGRAGDWVTVVPPPPPLPQDEYEIAIPGDGAMKVEEGSRVGVVRRRAEGPVDDDDTRQFKMRKKTVAVGLGDIYDPGIIKVKPPTMEPDVKGKSDTISESTSLPAPGPVLGGDAVQVEASNQGVNMMPKATERPTWVRRGWRRAGDDLEEDTTSNTPPLDSGVVGKGIGEVVLPAESNIKKSEDEDTVVQVNGGAKKEEPADPSPLLAISSPAASNIKKSEDKDAVVQANGDVKKEEPADALPLSTIPSSGTLFRKRKISAGSTQGRRRA